MEFGKKMHAGARDLMRTWKPKWSLPSPLDEHGPPCNISCNSHVGTHLLPQAVVQYDLDHGLTTLLGLDTDVEVEVSAPGYNAGPIRDTLHACMQGGKRSGNG